MSELVILVDERDAQVGVAEKLQAHAHGWLHRAFSVLVFQEDALLLQRRSAQKYHSGGLWSNTCCSHPRPGEATAAAAHRRLREEMGFDCELTPAFTFVYRAELAGGLIEHEYNHVLLGRCIAHPRPNLDEVADWRWSPFEYLRHEIAERPAGFTVWFRILLQELLARGGYGLQRQSQ